MKLNSAGLFLALALIFTGSVVTAQYSQTIRGSVVEQVLQQPLEGATVTIPALNRTEVTNEDGVFRFVGVPVGTYNAAVTYTGFKEALLESIIVNSGKEVVLNISLEADVIFQKAVEITAKSKKYRPINDMSLVSARAFTVEETQKYAAAVNDPLRMATSFAGVVSADDGNNEIVIRGNSPAGLLWRMEGC